MKFARALKVCLALFLAAPAGLAQAQAISALRNHDTGQPIDVDAARAELRDNDRILILTGNVVVVQGNMRLTANRMRVYYEKGAKDRLTILRIDADGGLNFTSPSEKAQSQWGIYDVSERQLTLGGDVKLNRTTSLAEVAGERLELNLRSGLTTLDGRSADGQPTTRVRGRFDVPERSSASPAPSSPQP
jgi:lipopolysaccharide export system protein LptA